MDTKRGALDVLQTVQQVAVETTEETLRRQREELRAAVKAARVNGATWQEIGDSLGVTRQAAWERFGK